MDENIKHLINVNERLATIETIMNEIRSDLKEHSKASLEMRKDVDQVKADIAEARVTLNTLKWVVGFLFISAPAAAVAFLKLYTSLN